MLTLNGFPVSVGQRALRQPTQPLPIRGGTRFVEALGRRDDNAYRALVLVNTARKRGVQKRTSTRQAP